MKHSFFLFFSAFLLAQSLAAQTTSTPGTHEEIVVTASALPESVEDTPASVTVVTRTEIESRAARDIADVLREVPGLTIARTGSSGHATSLFTRGSNSVHTLVLWNGIEINNPFFGGYDWGQFSTAGVEQVEVVRGPYSALYGSDAVAGVVNILTVSQGNAVRGAAEAGANGLRNAQVEVSHETSRTALSGAVESRNDDGFAQNDDFAEKSANVAFRWKAAPAFSIGLTGRYMSYDLGIPTNLNGPGDALIPSLHRRQDGHDRQLALPVDAAVGNTAINLILAETNRSDTLDDPDDPWGLTLQTTDARTRRARLSSRTPTIAGTITAGAEYERSTVDDVTNFGPNFVGRRRSERSFFLEDRYSHALSGGAHFEIAGGVRRDSYETFGSETSPRLAAAWIRGGHKIRAAYGEAFRAPSLGEMYSPWGGNPDLRAERSRSFEAGYDRFFDGGSMSVTLFRDVYRDLITNAGFVFANVGRARSRGIELSAKTALSSRVATGFTWTWLDAKQLGSQSDRDRQLLRRPRNSGSAFVTFREGPADLSLVILRSGERQDILPVFPFSTLTNRAWTTIDMNAQYHLGRVTPFLKIENAANAQYEEVRGYPSASRRASVGVRFAM